MQVAVGRDSLCSLRSDPEVPEDADDGRTVKRQACRSADDERLAIFYTSRRGGSLERFRSSLLMKIAS